MRTGVGPGLPAVGVEHAAHEGQLLCAEIVRRAWLARQSAYATALDLPAGLLVYAKGEANAVVHRVRNAGKRLEIATLDLSGSIESLHVGIADLARRIRGLRVELAGNRIAA